MRTPNQIRTAQAGIVLMLVISAAAFAEEYEKRNLEEFRKKISAFAAEGATGEIAAVAEELAVLVVAQPSVFWEEIDACGFYPQESRLECIITIKQRFGYGGPVGAFGSFEHTLFCIDWDNSGAFTTAGALGSTESVSSGNVHMHDQPQAPGPPWHYAVYRDIDPPGGPRTTLGGANTTTQTPAPTLRARAILSWTFAPTDCNYVPIWGTIFDFRIRMDPIR